MEITGRVTLRGKKIYDCVVDRGESIPSANSFALTIVVLETVIAEE